MSDTDRLDHALAAGLPWPDGPVLCLRPRPEPGWAEHRDRLRCLQSFRRDHDALGRLGLTRVEAPEPGEAALVCLTRARAENLGNIARAWDVLPDGAPLIVTGAKTDGIDSVLKQVRKAMPVAEVVAKAHGKLFWTLKDPASPPPPDWAHGAASRPNADGFHTAPGMFSPDRADPGSELLAARFGPEITGRVADLGAGWGWLSAKLLETAPGVAEVGLYEAEGLALDAARRNVPDARARFHWTDVTALPNDSFDWVITNPPFHQSRAAEPGLGQAFIAAAARMLAPSGTALIVANRQLPYESALTAAFRDWEELPGNGVYKLFRARRPKG